MSITKVLQCSNPDCVNKDTYKWDDTVLSCPDCRQILSERLICGECQTPTQSFSGLEHYPSGIYCPQCNDALYDDEGNFLMRIE